MRLASWPARVCRAVWPARLRGCSASIAETDSGGIVSVRVRWGCVGAAVRYSGAARIACGVGSDRARTTRSGGRGLGRRAAVARVAGRPWLVRRSASGAGSWLVIGNGETWRRRSARKARKARVDYRWRYFSCYSVVPSKAATVTMATMKKDRQESPICRYSTSAFRASKSY